MKALIFIVMVILFTNFTSEVEASNDNVIDSSRIAIQDSELTTSPFDFKAQAKALGMQTFSEKTAIEGTRTTELDNQFDDRMAKAQEAWIQLTKPDSITAEAVSKFGEDIEKFVQLETEVEWSVPHKIAFLEFRKRLSQIKPAFFSQQQKLAAISYFHLMQKKQISAHSIPVELSEAIQDLSLRMVSFSELPPEVDVVFVDGHSYSRSELQFPGDPNYCRFKQSLAGHTSSAIFREKSKSRK
jgi:hypothetical protein